MPIKLKPQVWVYTLPSKQGEGWARAFLTEDGMLTVMSDYDNYAYWWTSTGDDNFRSWFAQTAKHDPHYIMDKFGYGRDRVYNGQKTLAAIKEHIKAMEGDEQKLILDEIENDFSDIYDLDDFRRWIENGDHALYEFHEFAVYERDAQLRGFIERILPRLVEAIEEDLKQEAANVTPL